MPYPGVSFPTDFPEKILRCATSSADLRGANHRHAGIAGTGAVSGASRRTLHTLMAPR